MPLWNLWYSATEIYEWHLRIFLFTERKDNNIAHMLKGALNEKNDVFETTYAFSDA